MSFQSYLANMCTIQSNLLNYIGKDEDSEESYQNLIQSFNDQKIKENPHKLKSVLHLILNIANNHSRLTHFFSKIDKVLLFFKDQIKQFLSNSSLFNVFKSNKRILLFLIEEKLLTIDDSIASVMQSEKYRTAKYPQYFYPELKPFLDESEIRLISKEIGENFEENRRIGENHSELCKLIRNDSIEEFIIYFQKENLLFKKTVDPSIFETNHFLLKKRPSSSNRQNYSYLYDSNQNNDQLTLIEYAAFFGSIQIFKYLHKNGSALTPSLWIYTIHSQSQELINLLQDYNINPLNDSYKECFIESIKCHHNEMTNFIQNNILGDKTWNIELEGIKYYNFAFIKGGDVDDSRFYDYCKYDHCPIVDILLKEADIDAGELII